MSSRKPQWSDHVRKIVLSMRERGDSSKDVYNATNVPERTQRRWIADAKNGVYESCRIKTTMFEHNAAKVTPEYVKNIQELLHQQNDLFDYEIADELEQETGISITPQRVQQLRKKFKITRKLKQKRYAERNTPQHIEYLKYFRKIHGPKHGQLKYINIASTDEAGFESTVQRKYGKGPIKVTRICDKKRALQRTLAGGSYQDRSSLVYDMTEKHHSFRLNLVVTICIDEKRSVVAYKLDEEYANGGVFSEFVLNRNLPAHITHDLLDRATVHRSVAANEKRKQIPVPEVYQMLEIKEDWVPVGYPEMNPVEQLFSWIRKRLEAVAPQYNKTGCWDKEQMTKEIVKALQEVDINLVKSFYRASFIQTFPGYKIPSYLKDIPKKPRIEESTTKKRKCKTVIQSNKKRKL